MAEEDTTDEEFGFAFGEEGYTGEWVPLMGLELQFCLPDGWVALESDFGVPFRGISEDSCATLEVSEEARDVDDLLTWAQDNLSVQELTNAGLYPAAVVESDAGVCIYLLESDRVIAFRFDRESPEALSRETAIDIAGSVCEDWGEDEWLYDEVDDANGILAGDEEADGGW